MRARVFVCVRDCDRLTAPRRRNLLCLWDGRVTVTVAVWVGMTVAMSVVCTCDSAAVSLNKCLGDCDILYL